MSMHLSEWMRRDRCGGMTYWCRGELDVRIQHAPRDTSITGLDYSLHGIYTRRRQWRRRDQLTPTLKISLFSLRRQPASARLHSDDHSAIVHLQLIHNHIYAPRHTLTSAQTIGPSSIRGLIGHGPRLAAQTWPRLKFGVYTDANACISVQF